MKACVSLSSHYHQGIDGTRGQKMYPGEKKAESFTSLLDDTGGWHSCQRDA